MQIESIELIGCRDLEQLSWPDMSEKLATVSGPSPSSSALRDSLSLLFASFCKTALNELLSRWRWGGDIEVIGDLSPEQVVYESGERAAFLLMDEKPRRIQIDLTVALDAAQLGRLRDSLTREPQLLQASFLSPKLSFRWSALFNRGLTAAAFHISAVYLGDHRLESGPHPKWLKALFSDFSSRFSVAPPVEEVAELAAKRALSLFEPVDYTSFVDALSGLGTVRAARDLDGLPLLLLNERPVSQWHVLAHVQQAALLYLTAADVVWIDGPLLIDSVSGVQILQATSNGELTLDDSTKASALLFKRDSPQSTST